MRPCLRPSQVSPEMPPGGSYTMALVVDPPRRSARLASSTSKEAEEGGIDSPDEVSDSDSDEMGWEIEYEDTSDCPRDKHVLAWLSRLPRCDHHVLS